MGKKRDVRKQKPAEMPPMRWIVLGGAVVLVIAIAAVAMIVWTEPASATNSGLSGMTAPGSNAAGADSKSIEFTAPSHRPGSPGIREAGRNPV